MIQPKHFSNIVDLNVPFSMHKKLKLYSGTSNPELAQELADTLGVELQGLLIETFANGEIYCRYDESVRGADVFFIQSVFNKIAAVDFDGNMQILSRFLNSG